MWTKIQSEKQWWLACSAFSSDTCASGVAACTLPLKQNHEWSQFNSLLSGHAVASLAASCVQPDKMKPILNSVRLQSWTSAVSKPDSRLVSEQAVL